MLGYYSNSLRRPIVATAGINSYQNTRVEKSRLGRLLVNRGYITDEQLDDALYRQRATGAKLGEILVAHGLISQRSLARTLKHQQRYRYAAAFAAMVVAPLQPLVSFAASAPALSVNAPAATQQYRGGLQPLSELEMRNVQAQGTEALFAQIETVTAVAEGEREADPMEALKLMTRGLVPIINMLDADVSIRGVHYRPGEQAVRVLPDGRIQMMLPQRIERISTENIRPQNSGGPSMGDVYISDVRFSEGSSLKIYPH
jgi:hypothetical protein